MSGFSDVLMIAPVLVKTLMWMSAVVCAGGSLAGVLFGLPVLRLGQRIAAVTGAVMCFLSFGVSAAVLTGGWDGAFIPGIAGLLWDSGPGRGLALTAVAFISFLHCSPVKWLVLVKCLVLLLVLTSLSHLSGPMTGLLFFHLAMAMIWAGAILPFLLAVNTPDIQRAALRFGRFAPLFLVTLFLAGGILTFLKIQGQIAIVPATGWGQALIVKLGLVGGAALIGARNKYKIVPKLEDPDGSSLRAFRAAMRADVLIFIAILLVSAWLSTGAELE